MNQDFIDITLLLSSIIIAGIVTRSLRRRKAGPVFSTLLLFPPLLVFLNMWAHTVAVTVVNVKRYVAGSFHYSFTVYSHLLFGIVFILLSGASIHCSKKYLLGDRYQKRSIYLLNLATAVLFLPVGFINPIGFLPVLATLFSSITLLVYQPFKQRQSIDTRKGIFIKTYAS
ncbi:MAG TPA: hypothetical protein VGN63_08545 [Flavisolibacter sp.]|jgi:hypothetical protein|nr:hypothetical protein [Flavisolibacter sp.]